MTPTPTLERFPFGSFGHIYCDFDEVIGDFRELCYRITTSLGYPWEGPWLQSWNFLDEMPPEQCAAVRKELSRSDHWSCMQPLPGAIEAFAKLQALGDARGMRTYVVTAPYHTADRFESVRRKWCAQNLGLRKNMVAGIPYKADILGDGLLIEDKWSTIEAWLMQGDRRRQAVFVDPMLIPSSRGWVTPAFIPMSLEPRVRCVTSLAEAVQVLANNPDWFSNR